MQFSLDPKSGVPIYVQLKDQIKYQVASRGLQPGVQLPTVRQLAVDLRVNPNTVARVYAELEAEGLLTTQRGKGTFVAAKALTERVDHARQQKLKSSIQRCLAECHSLGFSIADVRRAIEEEMEEWEQNKIIR